MSEKFPRKNKLINIYVMQLDEEMHDTIPAFLQQVNDSAGNVTAFYNNLRCYKFILIEVKFILQLYC
jgi:hypothetical protein